ncbi:chemotaxis protein CheY [Pseudomonas iranensis]|uniref:chemotaxis protein CheY n=1 Tax=Pseudomonas iranensis TaxID=2745503 RepID=UPI001648B24F|nr:chemotaxis protein CheY [Pseudomonas iranensis]QXI24602.1 chemotaxis protein CheY [Pseudomonas iranensis]
MSNKALRILIADPQHFHRMKIERLFNALGYYRVAPVQTLGELLTLVDYGCEPFDVLVINAELAAGSLNLLGFLLDNPQVRHALIYNEQSAPLRAFAGFAQENAQISPTPLPNSQLIGQVMARVEACDERQAAPDAHASLRHANA